MWFCKNKDLIGVLHDVKKIKVKGVMFEIKKLDVSNYLDGSKSLIASYDLYKPASDTKQSEANLEKKIKEHYRDVFLGSVEKPILCRKEKDEGVFVDEIFRDWDLAQELYEKIMAHTYGKKKLKLYDSQTRGQLS